MKLFMTMMMFIIVYAPLLGIFALTPYITRKTESFGVSIPEQIYADPEVKKIRDTYRNNVLLWGGIVAIISFIADVLLLPQSDFFFLPFGIAAEMVLLFAFYLKGHKQMKRLKQYKNWTANTPQKVIIDTDFRKKSMLVSPWWFLSYAVVILATLGLGLLMYDTIPDRIPMNYNMSGEVTRWVNKSYKVLFFAPASQAFITFLMMFVYRIIGKAKQQIHPAYPEKSVEQNRIFRYRWSAFTVFMGLAVLGLFGFTQLSMTGIITNPWIIMTVPLMITGIIVAAAVVLSVTTGQGGSRIAVGKKASGEVINRDEDQYWKLGVFYYNPEDPALFVEKRFGVGWTNNFARPMSWVMLVGLLILIVLFVIGTTRMTG